MHKGKSMNYSINKKLLMFLSVGSLMMNGCIAKSELDTTTSETNTNISKWKNISSNISKSVSSSFKNPKIGTTVLGKASWYGEKYNGRRTASGDVFNMNKNTAAHKSLPFNTIVRVTNTKNNKSEWVRINDRLPRSSKREIDLSKSIAQKLGMINDGIAEVKIELLAFDGMEYKSNPFKSKITSKEDDCLDCYASPLGTEDKRSSKNTSIAYDYSKLPTNLYTKTTIKKANYSSYAYNVTADDNYKTTDKPQNVSYESSYNGNSSGKTAIQIGAFRKYAGAKVYAKKYDLLSSKYQVAIKTGVKNNKPLHRVRIEGFSTRSEAKLFMARYGITEAFLVRK